MADFFNRRPWLMLALQFSIMGLLITTAIMNAATNHGILMAINCFFLGFLTFAILASARVQQLMNKMNDVIHDCEVQTAMADTAADAFKTALESGRIEVIPVAPDQPTTMH